MAITVYRSQVVIPRDTALPEDVFTNTFHFEGANAGSSRATDVANIVAALTNFYNEIDGVLYPSTIGEIAAIKTYDLADPEPRAPLSSAILALTPTGTASLPSEVAICLSFQGAPVSGQPRARRRGRVFLGPVATTHLSPSSGKVLVDAGVRSTIANAASGLSTSSIGLDVPWSIYSPTLDEGGESLLNATTEVDNGWIDNAFDTVRKRGDAPTGRTTWT